MSAMFKRYDCQYMFCQVLNEFLAYRTKKVQEPGNTNSPWKYTDNAQLLFGGDFNGNTLGMATVSSMCGLRSGGVNEVQFGKIRIKQILIFVCNPRL